MKRFCLAALLLTTAAHGTELASSSHRGGTLRLTADSAFGSIDPQLSYALGFEEVFQVINDGLTAFRKVDGPASNDVVADLAVSLPPPEDGGLTYVFHLRPDIRFSDGRTITTDDVVQTFRRNFRVSSPATAFFSVIVGADICIKHPAGCMLTGGVVGDAKAGTITFHLTHPDSEFFDKLALNFGDIVPADTQDHDIGEHPVPATGPYMITRYEPNRHMTLARNPYFHQWDDQAQPDGYVDAIDYSFGLSDEAEVTAVENNQYDWMYDSPPFDRLGDLGSRFYKRTYVVPIPYTIYLAMNTHEYPFDHFEVREAVNYALDRRALAIFMGGPGAALPLCQVLPRNYPGYVDYCPFTKGADIEHPSDGWHAPDLARAKALVAHSGTAGARINLIVADHSFSRGMGVYIQSILNQLGYVTSVRALDFNVQFTYQQNTNNHVQISLTDWVADYPAASDYLRVLYGCDSFHPGSDASINIAGFCDRAIEAQMTHASELSVTDPKGGNALWSQIDREITDRALAANLLQLKWVQPVSSRLGNFTFSQISHMLFSKVWVQ
jgi:peptide/nickel transport system substrate-binding protein